MLVPLSWLRDFAPFDLDPVELGRVFDELGMVVEGIERVGEGLEGVVVARVLDIRPIEGLDRVRMTTVDAGDGEPLEVACGAWNFDVGATVPLATVGTTLPNGMTIGRRKMRGVWSNGMLCSPDELNLPGGHAGLLLLGDDLVPGTPFSEAMGIVPDVVYDLAIEGNRPDANSVVGVARDAAAKLGLPFTPPSAELRAGSGAPVETLATVRVEAPDLCPRFTATAIMDVEIGPSPSWVQHRLTLAGMRPINNVVDASNYVMLELGQPTHPYDLALLPGPGLLVRRATAGERLTTLDGVERILGVDGDDCVICDAEGTPVGIAGIMGGASSEISDATRHVLLETAYFTPMAIARTSKRLKLRSEASHRFERGTDPEGIDRAIARFVEVLGSGEVAPGVLDARSPDLGPREHILVRVERVNGLLGADLGARDIEGYLRPIGFATAIGIDGDLEVVPPTFRPDVTLEVDVIEEVARHHGYGRIARTVPRPPQVGRLTPYQRDRRRVREALVGAGLDEAITSSLLGPGDHERAGHRGTWIEASDPMVREESILRTTLLPGLLRALAHNAGRRVEDVALFEVGHVFLPPLPGEPLPDEREHLAIALASGAAPEAKRVWDVLVDALRLDGLALRADVAAGLHPTRTAAVVRGDEVLGHVGEVDPRVLEAWSLAGRVGWFEVDLGRLLTGPRRPDEQAPISRFPSSDVDLAFVVDDATPATAVEATLRAAAGDLLESIRLFDVYRGEHTGPSRRSLAFRLRFVAQDHTLTDAEVAEVRARCIDAVQQAHPAELRG